jgi:hypothetical protein
LGSPAGRSLAAAGNPGSVIAFVLFDVKLYSRAAVYDYFFSGIEIYSNGIAGGVYFFRQGRAYFGQEISAVYANLDRSCFRRLVPGSIGLESLDIIVTVCIEGNRSAIYGPRRIRIITVYGLFHFCPRFSRKGKGLV